MLKAKACRFGPTVVWPYNDRYSDTQIPHRQLFCRYRACGHWPTSPGELELLEAVRDKVPPEIFTKPFMNPVNRNPEAVRNNRASGVFLFYKPSLDRLGITTTVRTVDEAVSAIPI
jgi:hypothetical protein